MTLAKRYELRQPWLASISERSLDADFVRAARDGSDAAFDKIVRHPHAGVVELKLFSAEYTQALLRELHAFEHWCTRHDIAPTRPNTMNNHGVVLDELGLDFAMDDLLNDWLMPIVRRHFAAHDGDRLDHQHAFVVDYFEAGDTSLGFHVDDSEVTLNACLGFDFEGAEVYFRGERCESHRAEPASDAEAWEWTPEPGVAILHAGAHRHGVNALRSGRRVNLIVWARSSKYRRAHPAAQAGPASWCPSCQAVATSARQVGAQSVSLAPILADSTSTATTPAAAARQVGAQSVSFAPDLADSTATAATPATSARQLWAQSV